MRTPRRAAALPLLAALLAGGAALRAAAQVDSWPPTDVPASTINEVPLADLRINGALHGSISFLMDGEGRPLVKAELIRSELGNAIRPSLLKSLASWDRYIAPEELATAGINVSYDPASLILDIEVLPRAFKILDISPVRRAAQDPTGQSYSQEPVSLVLGTSASARTNFRGRNDGVSIAPSLGLKPILFVLGFIFQADADISYNEAFAANVDNAQVFRNLPNLGARISGGMVAPRVTSFQSSTRLVGLSLTRERSLPGGGGTTEPILDELVLERSAAVTVSVNDIVVSRSRLAPGSYRLSDLNLASGLNEVTVKIEEEGQDPRFIELGLPFDSAILRPGELDYAVSLGFDQATLGRPLFSAYGAAGLSRALQLGIDAQASERRVLGGLSAILASPLGNFAGSADLAHDFETQEPLGSVFAARLSWRLALPGNPYIPKLGAGLEYKSAGFASPLDLSSDSPPSAPILALSGQISESIPGSGISLALFGDAQIVDRAIGRSNMTLGLTFPLPSSITTSITAGLDWTPDGGFSPRASIAANFSPPDRRSLNYRHDMVSRETSFGTSIQLDKSGREAFTANASLPDGASLPERVGISYRRVFDSMDLRLGGDYSGSSSTGDPEAGLDLGISTSFALTRRGLALANPSGSTFALVIPPRSLEKQRIELRSNSGPTVIGSTDRPILVSGLKPYAPFTAAIDLPDAPPDLRIKPSAIKIVPDYGSVTVIKVSQVSTTIVRGTVVDEDGRPLRDLTGDLFDSEGRAIPFSGLFTDDRGFFECYGIEPGSHEIRWSDGRVSVFEVSEGEQRPSVELGVIVARPAGDTEVLR